MNKTINSNYNTKSFSLNSKNIKILCNIFRKMSYIREFELQAYNARKKNLFSTLIYLCLGQESIYASVSEAITKAVNFGQHRGHGIYLSNNGNPKKLIDELIGLESGTNKGMGGSPAIFDLKNGMYGHVGLIGDQVPVAAGYSLINKKDKVICYFGDGAAEEDYVLATFGFVAKNNLNIRFICDDNDLSVLTETKVRRNWSLKKVANSFGIESYDVADDPLTIYHLLKKVRTPCLLNIRTCREYWHEGAGIDKPKVGSWNRYQIIKKQLVKLIGNNKVVKFELDNKNYMENLWKKQLQKL